VPKDKRIRNDSCNLKIDQNDYANDRDKREDRPSQAANPGWEGVQTSIIEGPDKKDAFFG
jgi:hypothetical protein